MPPTAPQRANVPPIHEARRAFANGDLTATELICSEVLARAPDDGAAWALLTETALQRGRLDAAIDLRQSRRRVDAEGRIGLILRAKCLFVSGEAGAALEAAEAASKMMNNAPETLDACGAIFGLLGLHQKSEGILPARGRSPSRRAAISVQSRRDRANDRRARRGRSALRRRHRPRPPLRPCPLFALGPAHPERRSAIISRKWKR